MARDAGIDYSRGISNRDPQSGIHYGVIPAADIEWWIESSEGNYGDPCCPKCGRDAVEYVDDSHSYYSHYGFYKSRDYACDRCHILIDSGDAYREEPLSWDLDDGEYQATQGGDDIDIFILRSPYYTFAAYCSPCAPGAGYLRSVLDADVGIRTYCFGPEWFSSGECPYPIYRVSDGVLITPLEDQSSEFNSHVWRETSA